MKNLLLVFDLTAMVHRNAHVFAPTAGRLAFEQVTKLIDQRRPSHVACAIDRPYPTWRHELAALSGVAYKPIEKRTNGEERQSILAQLHACETLVEDVLGVHVFGARGFEGDDVVATLARRFLGPVLIAARDKDFNQLVSDRVHLLDFKTGVVTRPADVFAKYGVHANQFRDYLALVGDQSDGFAGCPGIGPKAASGLLSAWGTLDAILAASLTESGDERFGPSAAKRLRAGAASARLSQQLATLRTDAPIRLGHVDELLALPLPPCAEGLVA